MADLGGLEPPLAPPLVRILISEGIAWFPEAGCGYYPVPPSPTVYDDAYFHKYEAYARTEMGRRLNDARMALIARHYDGTVVDVGIGCGSFVEARPRTYGFDVNPKAIGWLRGRALWWSPYTRPCPAVSLWDVLEHIHDFAALLDHVREFVFLSLPAFTGPDHVLASRHYRKDEHCWYFTPMGLVRLMARLGWECREVNDCESVIGRTDIVSFAFRRRVLPC